MFSIEIPGRAGAVGVRFGSAADAIAKYRELEAEGFANIDVKNAKGDKVSVSALEQLARDAASLHKEGDGDEAANVPHKPA